MAYQFEGVAINITSLASGNEAVEPTAIQYHSNRINCIYRKANLLYIQYSDDRGTTWSEVSQIVDDNNAKESCICRNYYDGWALIWGTYTNEGSYSEEDWEIKFCQALSKISLIGNLLEATVNKGIDMNVNGFYCTIAQENHEYDFQKINSIWEKQLIPGNEIEFYVGLGNNLNKRFKGYIDTVDYKDDINIIEISGRSRLSILLDSKLEIKKQYIVIQTYQEVAQDLLTLAGINSSDYYIESTSITLGEEKIFDREESFLTCLQNLCDDMGWIVWEDEDGKIYIQSPQNYPVNLWNYQMNINCFSLSRNLDSLNIPYKIIVCNEDIDIEKEAIIDAKDFAILNQKMIEYLRTKEDNADNIQNIANNIASDLELKLFTINILVPYNFYLQIRDKVTILRTDFVPTISNIGIIINISESLGRKGLRQPQGLYSQLTIAVIS